MSKVEVDKKQLEDLKKKASFLEDLLEVIEDRYLGELIQNTEEEEIVSLEQAEEQLK